MKPKQIYSLLVILLFIITCRSTELAIQLENRDQHCFYDSLAKSILFNISVVCDQAEHLKFTITSNMHIIYEYTYEAEKQRIIQHSEVTKEDGDYEFCFENTGSTSTMTIYFNYRTGVEAKDYTDLISKEEGRGFQIGVQRLEDTLHDISVEKKLIVRHQQYNSSLSNELSFKIQAFSIITGVLLLALGIFQTYYLRKFFQDKKMI